MTFEIPFLAISLAVLFYGVQSNAFYTKFVAILFVVATVLEIGSLFLIYKWSYSYPLMRMIIASAVVLVCMFMMRIHRLGLLFFAVAIVAVYGQTFPGMLDYPEVVVRLTLWCIVVGLYPNAADGTDRRAVVSQPRGNSNAARVVCPARRRR
ncbi:multidrug efflux system protein MdtO [Salmonella enterica subsp. arizonae]|uniref:Multidrug efflux system protein MdtO n=1 Tax=Salmonella enterica subsp. arizonae TaxID=59203 RepID=A0A379SD00_SALER|nr:multidrug efflux system protein MdtO [Salmonella enterica subsp. arizonae]